MKSSQRGGESDPDSSVEARTGTPPVAPGPVTQSVAIGFRAVYAVTLLLAVTWLFSNIRQIEPDSQAVIMRFGRIVRVQKAGLLLALPRPFETLRLIPGPDRQLSRTVGALPPVAGIALNTGADSGGFPATASPYLTGDGNVVFLDAKLVYHIVDGPAYVLSQEHVAPALDRMFRSTAVGVAARWSLNDFLVAETNAPNASHDGASISALRAAVRESLLATMNARLRELERQNMSLGVEIDRIDMTAWLPAEAKLAFDAVLTAAQSADQQIAAARTEAERRRQGAQREGDRLLSSAQALAAESVVAANVNTAAIEALVTEEKSTSRESIIMRAYQSRLPDIMNRGQKILLVDAKKGAHFAFPGKQP